MVLRRLPVLVLALGLAACAAQPTLYKPWDGGTGYAEQQLDAETWRVHFAGNFDTPRETVENYLLYRSAEVMLFGGFERFIVLDKEVERTDEVRGYGYYPYPYHYGFHHGHHGFRHHHGFFVHHFDYPSGYYTLSSYTAYATIRTWSEAPVPGGLQVYDARQVIERLGPTIVLPQSASG